MLFTSQQELDDKKQEQGIVDERTTSEAVASLFSPVMDMPKTPWERMQDKHGTGGSILRILGTGLTGGILGDALMPELTRSGREQYEADMDVYKAQKTAEMARQQAMGYINVLQDGINTPEDALARAGMMGMPGIETYQDLEYVMTGQHTPKTSWQIIDADGYKMRVDPSGLQAPQYVRDPDGNLIRSNLTEAQAKKYSFLMRGAPRIRELTDYENNGIVMSRSKVTQLKAQEQADARGIGYIPQAAWDVWMQETLTPEERGYITAAIDSGMIALRDESGAAISAQEMLRQIDQTLMFDDYDDKTYKNQREARARKVRGYAGGQPKWVRDEFAEDLEYLANYDGSRVRPQHTGAPLLSAGNTSPQTQGALPPMTPEQMTTYLMLEKSNPESAARMIELLIEINGATQ